MMHESYDDLKSSLIKSLTYDEMHEVLTIHFRNNYPAPKETYKMSVKQYFEFSLSESLGKYYNEKIKNKLQKLPIMAEQQAEKRKPRGINKASDKKRFIKISIDTSKIDKSLFTFAENGKVYFNIVLQMLPDGNVDRFENLGMVTQDVPKKIYDAAPKDNKPSGNILGNGKELYWEPRDGEGSMRTASELSQEELDKAMEDLPF